MALPNVLLVLRGVVIYKKKILLLKRSENTKFFPGKWEFPGGKFNPGEIIENLLVREIFEETGLEVILLDKLAYMQLETSMNDKYKDYLGVGVVVSFFLTRALSDKVKIGPEHTDFKWVPLNELWEMDLSDQSRKALQALEERMERNMH